MSVGSSHQLWKRDLEGDVLTLTSECETSQELASFLEACRANSTVRTVAFRESFLPLRRIRQHLSRNEFIQMLQAICHLKSLVRIVIPPTMPGMLRGVTAAYFLPDWPGDEGEDSADEISYDEELYSSNLREWIANSALTFCTINDVHAIARSIEDLCPKLHWLEIQDFYFKLFRTSPRKSRQQQGDNSIQNETDYDDDDDNQCLLDPLFQSLASQSEFTVLKLSCHADYMPQIDLSASTLDEVPSPSFGIIAPQSLESILTRQYITLQHVILARLGLVDQHFQVIAENMPRLQMLEKLDLNANAQTDSGTTLMLQTLSLLPPTHPLVLLSMKPIDRETISRQEVEMDWTLVFPRNVFLQYLRTRTISLGVDSEHRSESGSARDNDPSEIQIQNDMAFVEFWLHVNRMHRCDWAEIALSKSSLWPLLLERLGRYSVSAQWQCLQTFLPQMDHFQ